MAFKFVLLASIVASVGLAQQHFGQPRIDPFNNLNTFNFDLILNERETTTPVPILKYVDRQNSDGSYTYGYEGGDGTYKIETRFPTGEVKGKYGYYDPTGTLREVEYGATPAGGFAPSIEGLVLPPVPAAKPVEQVEKPAQFANFAGGNNNVEETGRRVVVRRRRPNRPRARPTAAPFKIFEPLNQQPLQPAQPAASVFVPQPDPYAFSGHPAQDINLQTGTYSYSYGRK